jgi:hypothetical protein
LNSVDSRRLVRRTMTSTPRDRSRSSLPMRATRSARCGARRCSRARPY